jgi:hypothetical protein
MPIYSSRAAKLLTASVFALAVTATPAVGLIYSAPAAHAEGSGGVPVPDPVPVPKPVAQEPAGSGGCQPGESLDPSNGNCLPAMSPLPAGAGDGAITPPPANATGDTTRTIDSGEPADLVPNINGDSCTGYWESTVCYAEQGQAAVQPKTTISSSP